jgi:hypothetical protein
MQFAESYAVSTVQGVALDKIRNAAARRIQR